jgi:hypothetical protein
MRYVLIALALVGAATLALTATASGGGGRSPAQLQRAGWDCLNPAAAFPENPNVHCFPPGKLEAVVSGTAVSALLVAFATPDVNAEEAPFLGTEHMLRANHFHNQPCPTDPPGGPRRDAQSAALRVELPRTAVRLGLLHLPPLRQPLVSGQNATGAGRVPAPVSRRDGAVSGRRDKPEAAAGRSKTGKG